MENLQREGLELASISSRLLAFFIDFLFILMLSITAFKLFVLDFFTSYFYFDYFYIYFISMIISLVAMAFIYQFLFLLFSGTTIGCILARIRIVDSALFDNLAFFWAFVRALFFGLHIFFSFVLLCPLFCVSMIFTPTRASLYDLLSRSIVLKAN